MRERGNERLTNYEGLIRHERTTNDIMKKILKEERVDEGEREREKKT